MMGNREAGVLMVDENTLKITDTCMLCGEPSSVLMPRAAWDRWQAGEFIQDAWSEATPADREIVISGSHSDCWAETFNGEEEEDVW